MAHHLSYESLVRMTHPCMWAVQKWLKQQVQLYVIQKKRLSSYVDEEGRFLTWFMLSYDQKQRLLDVGGKSVGTKIALHDVERLYVRPCSAMKCVNLVTDKSIQPFCLSYLQV